MQLPAIGFVFAVLLAVPCSASAAARTLEQSLALAGGNRVHLQAAIDRTVPAQRWGTIWLIDHMPADDLRTLSADFLVEHVHSAESRRAKRKAGAQRAGRARRLTPTNERLNR